jgi:hypothetical protein
MADPRWPEVSWAFDPGLVGDLPDLVIPNTTTTDWQTLLDLPVRQAWPVEYVVGADAVHPLPTAADLAARPPGSETASLRVTPVSGTLVIFRWLSPDAIDFDISAREWQGQARLNQFCTFLRTLGTHLAKPVYLSHEGSHDPAAHALLAYHPDTDRVVIHADPPPSDRRQPA